MAKESTVFNSSGESLFRVRLLQSDDLVLLNNKADNLSIFSIIIVCSRESILVQETVNFLIKTGMPIATCRSIIVRNSNNEYEYYTDTISKDLDPNFVNNWKCLHDIPHFSETSYSLFLTSGAKISWGSVGCLCRTAQDRPEASVISAVFRSRTGRVVMPNRSRSIYAVLGYFKSWFVGKNLDFISVNNFFKDAFLIRNETLLMSYDLISNNNYGLPFLAIRGVGKILCVPSAQLISLGRATRE